VSRSSRTPDQTGNDLSAESLLDRRRFLQFLGSGALAATLPGRGFADPPDGPGQPPNVIVIFTDDQGYGDLGCYGAKHVQTPNIDRMAREGVRFTDFYAAAPRCGPSRAALMTARYPHRNGCMKQLGFAKEGGYPLSEVMMPEVLRPAGYRTACIGKWHLGQGPRYLPTARGFDTFFGLLSSHGNGDLPLYRDDKVLQPSVEIGTLTQRYTEEAIRFIETNKDHLFFLYLAHSMPHTDVAASPEFMRRCGNNAYRAAIAELDWSVGEILQAIKAHGLDDNTLVVFTSDNGPYKSGSSGPLRGRKFAVHEGGMRMPCVARWPGRVPAGSVCSEIASTMDLLPTCAALAGVSPPEDRVLDGRDIRPLLFGEEDARSPYDAFFYYGPLAVRAGKWKLHLGRDKAANRALKIEQDWRPKMARKTELYDLEKDIGEAKNLAAQHPDIVARLEQLIYDHLTSCRAKTED